MTRSVSRSGWPACLAADLIFNPPRWFASDTSVPSRQALNLMTPCHGNALQPVRQLRQYLRSIPPKYSAAHLVGFLKGKTAILHNMRASGRYKGYHFGARG